MYLIIDVTDGPEVDPFAAAVEVHTRCSHPLMLAR